MFTTLISLALENLLYLALHIEGISSFPKPLSAADEKKYFDAAYLSGTDGIFVYCSLDDRAADVFLLSCF